MHRGSLGESESDIDNSTTHNFDHRTRSSITNPYNRTNPKTPSARSKRTEGMMSPATNTRSVQQSTVRGAARRKLTARQRELKLLREVIKLQKNTNLQIPKAPFARVVREISLNINPEISRYTVTALEALQEATEIFVSQVLTDAYLLTLHRKCVTLSKADMMLIRALKFDL